MNTTREIFKYEGHTCPDCGLRYIRASLVGTISAHYKWDVPRPDHYEIRAAVWSPAYYLAGGQDSKGRSVHYESKGGGEFVKTEGDFPLCLVYRWEHGVSHPVGCWELHGVARARVETEGFFLEEAASRLLRQDGETLFLAAFGGDRGPAEAAYIKPPTTTFTGQRRCPACQRKWQAQSLGIVRFPTIGEVAILKDGVLLHDGRKILVGQYLPEDYAEAYDILSFSALDALNDNLAAHGLMIQCAETSMCSASSCDGCPHNGSYRLEQI